MATLPKGVLTGTEAPSDGHLRAAMAILAQAAAASVSGRRRYGDGIFGSAGLSDLLRSALVVVAIGREGAPDDLADCRSAALEAHAAAERILRLGDRQRRAASARRKGGAL